MKESTALEMIQSRLLVLQSKRSMLNSCQRRFDQHGTAALHRRVSQLGMEADLAQHQYRTAMLMWGSPNNSDYWLVAYSKLIEIGSALVIKLREATPELPPHERLQIAADAETLERIVEAWQKRMRTSMAAAVV